MKNETTNPDIALSVSYDRLFSCLSEVEVPAHLSHGIARAIYLRETRSARMRFLALGGISLASVVGIVASSLYISHAITQSGFMQYLSLAFSDSSVLAVYWKQFAFSLIETLPLVGVIGFLSAVGLFIWSAAKTAAQGARMFAKTV